jgi:flagellar FliL protein
MAKEKIKQDPKDTKDVPPEEDAEAPKKRRGGLFKLLIPVVIVLAISGGGAAWYFNQPSDGSKKVEQEKPKSGPPAYERLEQFTVNLVGGEHYLQVELSLKLAQANMGEEIKSRMPEIRDGVLRLLSAKKVEDLNTPDGKTKLSEEIKIQVNTILGAQGPQQGVVGVLFNSFPR